MNLENKHPQQQGTWKTNTHRDNNNNNNEELGKQTPRQITHHNHHHHNNNKRKLEKRILCSSGKFSRIYAQELQDEQASAMVNELIMDQA